ncbi:class I SAM-dependent RNA methyltransferase [Kocuria sp. cx-455]|uniref:class I SAM-dependent RNA methyltransferase n=1 Tax=Kocuria sp. cx-455 TaxID=2771377 RepID=UPI003D729DA0
MTEDQPDTPDQLTLRLTAVAHGGHMVSRSPDGRVVFVRHGAPGELVRVRLTDHGEDATFWRADVVEVLESSADRRSQHPWAAADALRAAREGHAPVGGAEFGHLTLDAQRELKRAVVAEQLAHLAGIVWHGQVAAVADESPDGTGWRTRLHLDVTADGTAGMYPHRSNDLVPITDMPLATDAISACAPWELSVPGAARLDIAAPANGGRPLLHVGLLPRQDPETLCALRARLATWGSEHGVSVTAQSPGDREIQTWSGEALVRESLEVPGDDALTWRVSPTGFWQIHRAAPRTLVDAVLAAARIEPGETVWDLYSGAGLFTAAAARAVGPGGRVFAVEGSPVTSADARENVAGRENVRVTRGDVARVLTGRDPARRRRGAPRGQRRPAVRAPRPDVVILDPPRSGAAKEVLSAIDGADPHTVVYVACDPAALGRDLGRLSRRGWKVATVKAFDLYPNTHHVEAVAVLRRNDAT